MNRLLDMFEEETSAGLTENKKVGSEDMLFATLDTAHRKLSLGKGMDFILIDTVGFVSGLPHDLVDAFKSTLEEVKDADVLVHVVDNSREDKDFQIEVTGNVIRQLGAGGAYTIMAYNKTDIAPEEPMITGGNDAVFISARTGDGMDALADAIRKAIFSDMVSASLLIPYDKGSIVSYLCENGQVDSMDYKENGTLLTGTFREADYNKYRSFSI